MADPAPDPGRCKKALKILEQFERLARKLGRTIPPKRLARLKALRDAGTIRASDLPAILAREFPGEFAEMTLDAIRDTCAKRN
jgi:hypothetical protein